MERRALSLDPDPAGSARRCRSCLAAACRISETLDPVLRHGGDYGRRARCADLAQSLESSGRGVSGMSVSEPKRDQLRDQPRGDSRRNHADWQSHQKRAASEQQLASPVREPVSAYRRVKRRDRAAGDDLAIDESGGVHHGEQQHRSLHAPLDRPGLHHCRQRGAADQETDAERHGDRVVHGPECPPSCGVDGGQS
jgi:hypothetical protein